MQNIGLGAIFTFIDNSATGLRNAQANFSRFTSTISGDKGASAAVGGFQNIFGKFGSILPPGIQNLGALGGQFGGLITTLGPWAAAVGASALALGKMVETMSEAMKVARDFEFGIAKIKTLLPSDNYFGQTNVSSKKSDISIRMYLDNALFNQGLANAESATARTVKQIERMVSEGGIEFGKRQTDMLKGTYDALSSGIETSDIDRFMNVVGKMAVGGDVDMKVAVGALASIKNAYNFNMEDMTRVSDMMFNAVNKGVFEMKDLTSALGQVTGISAGLGVGLDEVLAMTSTLSLTGRTASESITGIKQAMMTVMAKTPMFIKGADDFGIKYDKATIASMGFSKWLVYANEKLKAGGADMSMLFRETEALNAVLPLTGIKMATNADILKSMGQSAGLTTNSFNLMKETMQFKEDRLAAVRESFLKNLGTMFLPISKAWVDFKTFLYGELKSFLGIWGTNFYMPFSATLSPVFSVIGKIIGVIWNGLKTIWTISAQVNGFFFRAFLAPLKFVGSAFLSVFNLIGDFVANVGKKLEPLIDIFRFVGGLAIRLLSLPFKIIGDTAGKVFAWLGAGVGHVFNGMADSVGKFVTFFVDMFNSIPRFIAETFINTANFINDTLYGILRFLLSVVKAPIELLEKTGAIGKGTYAGMQSRLAEAQTMRSAATYETGSKIYDVMSKVIQEGLRKRDLETKKQGSQTKEDTMIDLLAAQNDLIGEGNEERKRQGKKKAERQENDYDILLRSFVPVSVR